MGIVVFWCVMFAVFWILPAAIVANEFTTGKYSYALIICLLGGPLGIVLILSIEYAKTVFQPDQPSQN